MRYTQYKGVVEREYKKSLRKIMYELCVVEGLDSVNGALRLGVAKTIFEYWRNFYRYEDHQRLFDQKVQELDKMHFLYVNEGKKQTVPEPLQHTGESSLGGFKEQVEKMTAYYRQVHDESEGLAVEASNLPLYEFVEELLQRYEAGELLEEIMKNSPNAKKG
ncbi:MULTISPECIES: hypothetical protein [unclassified Planococcus (in: firmicutes)]|uniref:hypothetical protein n=1 Tax=Planococcus TaxID=1372 RepID=UPI000C7C16EC|nr:MULTISPECIES: hypothetical protein [unclassified Planococcus (in: firmicutes)]PKG46604.1 hypothetical protein CXF66_05895 [Planococcus sp. Urea-trap-24]PKG89543.1 hypothetical protein CXF91_07540 [Planococcus sp. Urea-3u-39]PKH42889.1 hypothetical protein CXF77_00635 [Planococcus sp. MB-3u-09]